MGFTVPVVNGRVEPVADASLDVDRTVAGMVLGALGVLLAVYNLWQLTTDGPAGLVGYLVGAVPGFLLALLLPVTAREFRPSREGRVFRLVGTEERTGRE